MNDKNWYHTIKYTDGTEEIYFSLSGCWARDGLFCFHSANGKEGPRPPVEGLVTTSIPTDRIKSVESVYR